MSSHLGRPGDLTSGDRHDVQQIGYGHRLPTLAKQRGTDSHLRCVLGTDLLAGRRCEPSQAKSGALMSMAGYVRISEHVRFKFQIIQPVLDHVAYADKPSQFAVAKYRHVAHAMAGHQMHQMGEIIPEGRGDQAVRHDVLYLHRRNWRAVLRKCAHNIAFGNHAENSVVTCHH